MSRIFHVYASNGPADQELDLPASDYEMLDLMERLRLKPGAPPYLEVLEYHDYDYLAEQLQEQADIYQLNGLARKLAGLDDFGRAAFEGLVGMEIQKGAGPVPLPRLIDFANSPECCHVVEEAMTDYELGRFYAENGFVSEAEDLTDEAFELLDFRKIGQEYRTSDGGVFTSLGYVMKHSEVPHLSETMDFQPHKPPYTIQLNTMSLPLTPCPKRDPIPIQLPAPSEQLQETLEKLGCTSWSNTMVSILDCPLPAWNHKIFLDEEIPQVFKLAEQLRQLEANGKLVKYKDVLEAADCQDVAEAVLLAETVDDYNLLPDIRTVEEAAKDDLRISIDEITLGRRLPHINLQSYGLEMLERYNAQLTGYGQIGREDGQLVQTQHPEAPENTRQFGMEMMQ